MLVNKIKFISAGIIVSLIIIMLVPFISVSAVAKNPLGFLGDVIFDNGDTDKSSKEVKDLYNEFIQSDIGEDTMSYLTQKISELKIECSNEEIILPLLLSFTQKDFDKLEQNYSIEDIHIPERIDKLLDIRKNYDNAELYISALKRLPEYSKLNQLADSTLLSYINDFKQENENSGNVGNNQFNLSSDYYLSNSKNIYLPTYRGQCTWFCYGRSLEKTGKIMPSGNARDWYTQTNLRKGKKPRSNSVAVFAGSEYLGYQHVVFVEEYKNDIITFSEGNYSNPCTDGSCDMVAYAREHYKELTNTQTMPYEKFIMQRTIAMNLIGFIYTD